MCRTSSENPLLADVAELVVGGLSFLVVLYVLSKMLTDPDEPTGPERFRKLPERIRLEDTIATQNPDPAPTPP